MRYRAAMSELSPIESEFASTEEAEAHDRWVREKVMESLNDPRPDIPHDEVVAEFRTRFEQRRHASAPLER